MGLDGKTYQLMDGIGLIATELIQSVPFDSWSLMKTLLESEGYLAGIAEVDGVSLEEARQESIGNSQIAYHFAGIANIIQSAVARKKESSSTPVSSTPAASSGAESDV